MTIHLPHLYRIERPGLPPALDLARLRAAANAGRGEGPGGPHFAKIQNQPHAP
jgi:hypothetical protein